MRTLATVYVRFVEHRDDAAQRALAEFTLKALRHETDALFGKMPIELSVVVEAGSVITRGRVFTAAGVVVAFLSTYEGLRSGSAHLYEDVKSAAQVVSRQIREREKPVRAVVRTTTGVAGKLDSLFERVAHNDLSPEEATKKAMKLLDDGTIADTKSVAQALRGSFKETGTRSGDEALHTRHRLPTHVPAPLKPTLPHENPRRARSIRVISVVEDRFGKRKWWHS